MHFKEMFDSQYAGVWDLNNADRVVTIKRVSKGTVGGHQGKAKASKAIVTVAELDKPLVFNVTNATTVAGMYGPSVKDWIGKRITLFPTTTQFGRDTVDCIRVRPRVPQGGPTPGPRSTPVDQGQREAQNRAAGRDEPHPLRPVKVASTPAEMIAAVRECATTIGTDQKKWAWVVEQCARVEADLVEVEAALNEALEATS